MKNLKNLVQLKEENEMLKEEIERKNIFLSVLLEKVELQEAIIEAQKDYIYACDMIDDAKYGGVDADFDFDIRTASYISSLIQGYNSSENYSLDIDFDSGIGAVIDAVKNGR